MFHVERQRGGRRGRVFHVEHPPAWFRWGRTPAPREPGTCRLSCFTWNIAASSARRPGGARAGSGPPSVACRLVGPDRCCPAGGTARSWGAGRHRSGTGVRALPWRRCGGGLPVAAPGLRSGPSPAAAALRWRTRPAQHEGRCGAREDAVAATSSPGSAPFHVEHHCGAPLLTHGSRAATPRGGGRQPRASRPASSPSGSAAVLGRPTRSPHARHCQPARDLRRGAFAHRALPLLSARAVARFAVLRLRLRGSLRRPPRGRGDFGRAPIGPRSTRAPEGRRWRARGVRPAPSRSGETCRRTPAHEGRQGPRRANCLRERASDRERAGSDRVFARRTQRAPAQSVRPSPRSAGDGDAPGRALSAGPASYVPLPSGSWGRAQRHQPHTHAVLPAFHVEHRPATPNRGRTTTPASSERRRVQRRRSAA
jgi:hypothetical protein